MRRKVQRRDDSVIPIGRVVGIFGIKGGIKVEPMTHFAERFDPGSRFFIEGAEYHIDWVLWHKTQARIGLKGFSTVESVEPLIGSLMQIPADERPMLDKDEFYAADLMGLMVQRPDGSELGPVDEILTGNAQDILRIGHVLIPMVREFVKEINLEKGIIRVDLIPGMEDVNL